MQAVHVKQTCSLKRIECVLVVCAFSRTNTLHSLVLKRFLYVKHAQHRQWHAALCDLTAFKEFSVFETLMQVHIDASALANIRISSSSSSSIALFVIISVLKC